MSTKGHRHVLLKHVATVAIIVCKPTVRDYFKSFFTTYSELTPKVNRSNLVDALVVSEDNAPKLV